MHQDIRGLSQVGRLVVRQKRELFELLAGIETRNKYEVTDDQARPLFYAAEQGKSFLATIARAFAGHWRRFEIHLFNPGRELVLVARHPFRWFFQRLEVYGADGTFFGAIQQRFAWFKKRFDVEDSSGRVIYTVNSPLFSLWTFRVQEGPREVAVLTKKWGGILTEMFTDKDQFLLDFRGSPILPGDRAILLVMTLFVDLMYFETRR